MMKPRQISKSGKECVSLLQFPGLIIGTNNKVDEQGAMFLEDLTPQGTSHHWPILLPNSTQLKKQGTSVIQS